MKKIKPFLPAILLAAAIILVAATTIEDFFLPGSQIGQSGNIETPDKCDNCHGGYNNAVEPAFTWRGSMMSQAARDPLFYACLAIANQDAPDVGDLCLRCHTPDGWLNGRCVPTDGSALNSGDRQGVQCDFCHKLVKPTPLGVNPFPGNTLYTSTGYGTGTYNQDQSYLKLLNPIPGTSANGMYIADANNAKRGPFSDAVGRHQMFYSPFHSETDICGTCHDVSNPAFTRLSDGDPAYTFNTPGVRSATFEPKLMFPVERTYGEWRSSMYNAPGTANHKTCQDCHMRDVTGKGAKMNDAPVRTNLPLHDMTGGNTFVPTLVKQQWPAEVNAAALDAGVQRAVGQLKSAADLILTVSGDKKSATVKVINNTGHKLPTGYPEGRRIWINIKAYAGASLVYESGAYDPGTAILTKTGTKIYECEPGLSEEIAAATGLPAGPSFHFAINSKIYFDNRIPPAGFTNEALKVNQSPSVDHDGNVVNMYPNGQNWDQTIYALPDGVDKVEANLYYQTTSKEYVEFLRDNNTTNTKGQDLYNLWAANGKSAPVLMNQAIWSGTNTTTPELLVKSITATILTSKSTYTGQATVRIYSGFNPVGGASVTATYTGTTKGTATGTTLSDGTVVLKTSGTKTSAPSWCFTVTNVALTGYAYVQPDPQPSACTVKSGFISEQDVSEVFASNLNIFPNPVNGKARVDFSVGEDAQVKIIIYNNLGQPVEVLTDKYLEAGRYFSTWDGTRLADGIYYCRMTIGSEAITKTLILNK